MLGRKKKGQLEIMGLVIIVVLISLALLFAIQFMVLRKSSDQDSFTREQLAANTVNSLVITTTTCNGLDFTELVQDCASFNEIYCDDKQEQDSCEFLSEFSGEILGKTLKVWGKKYTLNVVSGKQELIRVTHVGCAATKDASVYPIPSKVGGDNIFVKLEVCE